MAVNMELTKEQILAMWKLQDHEQTLEEMDTMAHYNEEYLKENGWVEQGIGFYFNDKYKTDKFVYWFDCNAVAFTLHRFEIDEKENIEVGNHDMRNAEHHGYYSDIVDAIAWLDTAIGHEEEYCIHLKVRRMDDAILPGKIKQTYERYLELTADDTHDMYYRGVYGKCLVDEINRIKKVFPIYEVSPEMQEVYNKYKNSTEEE